jgi:hypothetical protein
VKLNATEAVIDWLNHPQTEEVYRNLTTAKETALDELIQACEKTTDPNVMRALRQFTVIRDIQKAMKGLHRAPSSDAETA